MKLTRKEHHKKYPLICPVCGSVAVKEFKDELCGVCKEGKFVERR